MTRFRFGIVIGLSAGYYLGARAGRERYLQINRAIDRARSSHLLEKAMAAVDLGRERLRPNGQQQLDLRTPSYN